MIKKLLAILTIASLFGIGAAAADTTTEIILQKNSVAKVIPVKATPEAQGYITQKNNLFYNGLCVYNEGTVR